MLVFTVCMFALLLRRSEADTSVNEVDEFLGMGVPHTTDMASLNAQIYYPNKHSKQQIKTGDVVKSRATGNKWKVVRILTDKDNLGKIWFAERALDDDKFCALIVRGTYEYKTLWDNFDWETVKIPGTNYKVVRGYQTHILAILNNDNNLDKTKAWLSNCHARGYTKLYSGHSLGGSTSTWLAMYFESDKRHRADYVVTFGAPRLVQTFGSDRCPKSLQTRSKAVRIVTADDGVCDTAALQPPSEDVNESFCFESISVDKAGALRPKDKRWPNWSYNYVTNAVPGLMIHDEETKYEAWIKTAKKKVQDNKPCYGEGTHCDNVGDWWGVGSCDKHCCHGAEYRFYHLRHECSPKKTTCKKKGEWCDAPGWMTGDCGRCCNHGYEWNWWKFRHECK